MTWQRQQDLRCRYFFRFKQAALRFTFLGFIARFRRSSFPATPGSRLIVLNHKSIRLSKCSSDSGRSIVPSTIGIAGDQSSRCRADALQQISSPNCPSSSEGNISNSHVVSTGLFPINSTKFFVVVSRVDDSIDSEMVAEYRWKVQPHVAAADLTPVQDTVSEVYENVDWHRYYLRRVRCENFSV